MIPGHDRSGSKLVWVKIIVDVSYPQVEHLVKVAVVDASVPPHGDSMTAHQPPDRGGVEGVD
jgi:hypothetical protein